MSDKKTTKEQLDQLRAEVELNPDSAKAHMRLGLSFYRAGLSDDAEKSLRRALELEPKLHEAWVNLGGVFFSRWNFKGCLEATQQALTINPESIPALYNQGLAYLYLKQADEMVECFRRLVILDPDNAGGHYHLAVGLNAQGLALEAKESLDRAERLGFSPEPEFLKDIDKALNPEATAENPRPEEGHGTCNHS